MLVLSRKSDQSIYIDENITLKVIEIRGGRVRLGIEAPDDVVIRRSEVVKQFEDSTREESTASAVAAEVGEHPSAQQLTALR